jgi:hypothetical protein
MVDRLASLLPAERLRPGYGDPARGDTYKTARCFFDFIIDGISLYDVCAERRDRVSVIWTDPPVVIERTKAIQRLLLREPGDALGGRVSLYTCPECGDLGCGAITARIEGDSKEVVWRDLGFENNYELDIEREAFASLGPFHLERIGYEKQFEIFLPH